MKKKILIRYGSIGLSALLIVAIVFTYMWFRVSVSANGLLSISVAKASTVEIVSDLPPSLQADIGTVAPEKITDETKKVKDANTRKTLQDQGIDPDYVELIQDYTLGYDSNGNKLEKKSPYARFYKDRTSSKEFMEVSGLPMVDADGDALVTQWFESGSKYYNSASNKNQSNNIFWAEVDKQGNIKIVLKNDQSDGKKAGQTLIVSPEISIDGGKLSAGDPTLFAVDLANPNYQNNVLRWDYGNGITRQIRMVEGSFQGSWIFASKPSGTVRIKYNQAGDFRLDLGQFAISDDEEQVTPSQFDELVSRFGYPVTISDSATYYPDAHAETSTFDGNVGRVNVESWASIRTGNGTVFNDAGTALALIAMSTPNIADSSWASLYRSDFLFNLNLPVGSTILAITESIYGYSGPKTDGLSCTPDVAIYSAVTSSNTGGANTDFQNCGSTAYSSACTYANWIYAYVNFALNATAIAAAQAILSGVFKTCARNANYDVAGTTPNRVQNAQSALYAYYAEQGTGYNPKLVVTYTAGGTSPTVVTGTASSIHVTTASVSENVTNIGSANVTSWGTQYGTSTAYSSNVTNTGSQGAAFGWSDALSSLSANTTYHFRGWAINSNGIGYGADGNFTTSYYGISNAPTSKAFGILQPNSTNYAGGTSYSNPVTDEQCTFTLTNSGDTAKINIKETNPTGGVGWTLTSGSPGSNTIRDTAFASGSNNTTDGKVLATGDQTFIASIAGSGTTIKWDFKRETGTFTDGIGKTSTITLTAVAP